MPCVYTAPSNTVSCERTVLCSRWPRRFLIHWITASTVCLARRTWTWLWKASGRPARSCWLKQWVLTLDIGYWYINTTPVVVVTVLSFIVNFLSAQIPPASKSFQEAQSDLNQTAADLNQSAGEVVHASRGSSTQLAVASGKFSEDFDEFLDAGIEMAGHTQVCLVAYYFCLFMLDVCSKAL